MGDKQQHHDSSDPKDAPTARGDAADGIRDTDGPATNNNNNNPNVRRVNCSSPRAPIVTLSPDNTDDCISEDELDGEGDNDSDIFSASPPSCNILDANDDVILNEDDDTNVGAKRDFPVPNVADLEVKVLVIGATNSGKTSLIEKYLTGSNSSARTTLCLDINKARIPFHFMGHTYHLTFYIYDMAGMKKFQSHNSSYYSDVFAVLFVFDITCRISLNFTINWLGDYCNFCHKQQFSPKEKILVCNKCDLPNSIMTRDELMSFAQISGMTSLFECSAKTGRNVDSLFNYIAQQFLIEEATKATTIRTPSSLLTTNEIDTPSENNDSNSNISVITPTSISGPANHAPERKSGRGKMIHQN